ncbi:IS30 family transposase, partial [Dermacoccus nishinomiyaensis]|uniref:IS30 family transposase n=1 Tax=Dermacoccus nishinomiyaensis TaxID=1274 RepID=UPI001EF6EFD9
LVRVVALPDGYKADAVRDALIENLADVPPQFRRSLTWDRGREMAFHDQIAHVLGMQVFFCDARSPWQRGTNENTNRLLRQYLAKNADLRSFTQADLDTIAARINERPRKVLDWASSHDAYADSLNTISGALTG